MNMQYSLDGQHLTERMEGDRLTAYPDPSTLGKPWTIGYGHTNGVQAGDMCTQAQAEAWLLEDVQTAVAAVNRLVTVSLSQHQFDALVDFTFNAGEGNFANSTMLRLLNAGDFMGAELQFARWSFAGGAHMAGLAARRAAEATEFDTPDEGI